MGPVHRLTKSPLDFFSTLPKVCFHMGRRLPEMHFLRPHPFTRLRGRHTFPDAAITALFELVVAKLKEPFV